METQQHARSLSMAAVAAAACVLFGSPTNAQNAGTPAYFGQSALPGGYTAPTAAATMGAPQQIAQAPGATTPPPPGTGSSSATQLDLTPVKLPERGTAFGSMQNLRTGILYYMPAKMFFNATVENSDRLETNVLQTEHRNHIDQIYRILPNVTLGYAPTRTSRISANYFYFRDQYMSNASLLSRNIHSVGFRGDKDWILSPRTTFTTSFFARELFVQRYANLCDLIPSATIVHRVGSGGAVYASVLGQLRWRDVFAKWQEGDTFYSLGSVYRTPRWTFIADTTMINNFGRPALRGGVANNTVIVMTLEAGRKVSQRLPLTAFVRAEPIFNIGQASRQGYAGVNFRLFGGVRAEISKPAIFPVSLRRG